jgi:hypothetical protein
MQAELEYRTSGKASKWTEEELSNFARLQACSVVRVPKFLTEAEIASVHRVHDRYRDEYDEPLPKQPHWVTTYLSASATHAPRGLFRATAPALFAKLEALRLLVDANCAPRETLEALSVRCVELHAYAPGGGLAARDHFDGGSVVTCGVMLDDGFAGGEFQTPEGRDGAWATHRYERGDALVFPSGKFHGVRPVTAGRRKVMILEFWNGVERNCDHRCPHPDSRISCGYVRQWPF